MSQSPAVPVDAANPPPTAGPLGARTARGFLWNIGQVFGVKAVSFFGQIILSWLLDSKAFGYVSLAYLVTSFASLIAQAGVREVLIQRWKDFEKWSTTAFWLSFTLGLTSTILMCATAPLWARLFHDPRLTGLILALCLQNLFLALCQIPEAKLNIDLRFKALSMVNFINSTAITVLTVILAFIATRIAHDQQTLDTLGAYAFILPWPIASFLRACIVWWLARQRVAFHPRVRQWPNLLKHNSLITAAAFFLMITWQCDYMILGWMYPEKEVVGRYFWAFNLSSQALQLLAANVAGIIFPSLAKMQDEPVRLLKGFLRAAKALVLLSAPACLLQAALAKPLVHLVFKPEWYPAILIVQILSLGWTCFVVRYSCDSLFRAQGRFWTSLKLAIVAAVIFLPCVYIGARLKQAEGAAIGVGIYATFMGPLSLYIATKKLGGTLRSTLRVFLAPTFAGIIAVAIPMYFARFLPENRKGYILQIILVSLAAMAIYLPLIRLTARDAFDDLMEHAKHLLHRPSKSPVTS